MPCDGGNCQLPMGVITPYQNDAGVLIDYPRLMIHPSFRDDIAGEGYYEYPKNPEVTLNFIFHPAHRVDMVLQPTITSSIVVRNERPWSDVTITEIWLGGRQQLSALNEMYLTFYEYWLTDPGVGEHLGWCPFGLTSDRYLIDILDVRLGGVDVQYREVRQHITQNRNETYLDQQLTLVFKLAAPQRSPRNTVSLTGV